MPSKAIMILFIAVLLLSTAASGVDTAQQAQIKFFADRTSLQPGECTLLHWEVSGGLAVSLNGNPVEKTGQKEVCPGKTLLYTLSVDLGTSVETRQVEIVIGPGAGTGNGGASGASGAVQGAAVAAVKPGEPAYKTKTWVKLGGPPGGLGYDIRMDPQNPDVMYVTDSFAGIMKSLDGGKTWVPNNKGITPSIGPTYKIFSATIDPFDHNTIWIGTQNTGEIYRSTDGGQTWVRRDNGVLTTGGIRSVRGITIDPNHKNVVFVGVELQVDKWSDGTSGFSAEHYGIPTGGEIYRSRDGGANWTRVWQGDSLARYVWIDPRNSNRIYVSTGIFTGHPSIPISPKAK